MKARNGRRGFSFPVFGIALPFAAACAVLLSSCLLDREPEPEDIFPLAVGNAWTYADSAWYGEDSVVASQSHLEVLGVLERGEYLLNWRNESTGQPSAFTSYVRNIGRSQYNAGAAEGGAEVFDNSLHLRYPVKTGAHYLTRFPGFRTEGGVRVPFFDTVSVTVLDAQHACTVPAGTFACVQYEGRRSDGSVLAVAYYAPGVGHLGSERTEMLSVDGSPREVVFKKKLQSYLLR